MSKIHDSFVVDPLENLFTQIKTKLDSSLEEIGLHDNYTSDSYSWSNHIYHSPSVRYGHLEYFKGGSDKVEVVHCVLFPNYYKGIPVFGFDVIKLSGSITGLFCDFTPCPFNVGELERAIKVVYDDTISFQRKLPEWAAFFSKNFISLSPTEQAYPNLEEKCLGLLDIYLSYCAKQEFSGHYLDKADATLHVEGQNKYSLNQRNNVKTQKALSKYVGYDKTKSFIENTLFPAFKS